MGFVSHQITNFGPPFLLVDESIFVIPKGGRNVVHGHHFKFLFVLNGRVGHKIEGANIPPFLEAGDVLIVPCEKTHVYLNPSKSRTAKLHVVKLFLDASYFKQDDSTEEKKNSIANYVVKHFPVTTQIINGLDVKISELLRELRNETEQKNVGYEHRVHAICTNLIIWTSRKTQQLPLTSPDNHASHQQNLIPLAKEFILKHLDRDLRLSEIAWHVGKGEEHLARIFKRHTGQTVFNFVREMRINKAKTYLADPSLSLSEIARQCGFQSLSFFSRTFTKQVGFSPSVYRNLLH